MKKTKRLWALLLAMVMALGLISTAFAAPTIDSGRKASLSLYKYDITAASADGAWDAASYVSTGVQDDAVTDKLAKYAIQGVEFSYLRVASISTYSQRENGQYKVGVLYGFAEDTVLQAIGLTAADAHKSENGTRYGKKYCHNSPTLDEAPLQQAILAVLNTAMADKNSLIRQITAAMETELIPFPGGTMSLGDIECRLRVLEQQFQTLLEKATDDPAAYGGQFKEILDEQTFLKEKRSVILANNNEQTKANQRIMDAAQTLENASPYITEWDESAVRQLVETVKILSKDEVAVTLKGGIEIRQKIMY